MFVAGLIIGDARVPGRREITRFHSALASLAEIVAFAMLGLTIGLGAFLVEAGVPGARRLYEVLFVVVTFSVIVQGGTLPWLSRRLRIPRRDHGPFPPLAQGAFTSAQHGVTCHQHAAASLTTPRAAGGGSGQAPARKCRIQALG